MAELQKLDAIKRLRDAWPHLVRESDMMRLSLQSAKAIADLMSEHVIDTADYAAERRARDADARADAARADLVALIRLVDYFVAHPAEYEAWKAEHA